MSLHFSWHFQEGNSSKVQQLIKNSAVLWGCFCMINIIWVLFFFFFVCFSSPGPEGVYMFAALKIFKCNLLKWPKLRLPLWSMINKKEGKKNWTAIERLALQVVLLLARVCWINEWSDGFKAQTKAAVWGIAEFNWCYLANNATRIRSYVFCFFFLSLNSFPPTWYLSKWSKKRGTVATKRDIFSYVFEPMWIKWDDAQLHNVSLSLH